MNAMLAPLAPLVGHWRLVGHHPMLPDAALHGEATFEWIEGGAFLVVRTEMDHPRMPMGVSIIGGDAGAGDLFMLYFDERGVSRKYDVTFADGTLAWSRDNPQLSQRFAITLEGASRMTGRGEMSHDGRPWEDDLSLTYVREA